MTGSVERGHRGGVARVLAKLDKSLEDGDFYEAHQMYRTLYFRYTAQKKYDECMELLYNGAQKLIAKEQETSAADLGLLLLETLEKRGTNGSGDNKLDEGEIKFWIDRLGSIIAQLSASVVERETLISRALTWSGDVSGNNLGHPAMHKLIAQIFWSENNIEQARHHYLLCRDGQLCGRILIKISTTKGYKSEKDLFIVQAVLQQLCLKETSTAEDTFLTYTLNHPQIRQATIPFYLPLLNFLHFLFRTIEMGLGWNSFCRLKSLYSPSLARDPMFDKYLRKIGMLYFGASPRSNQGGMFGGMFGDLFSRIFQDLDGIDDDEENDRHGSERRVMNLSNRFQNELD